MAIRNAKNITFRARGLTDAVDGTNAFPGSMMALQDLVPNPANAQQFVPRPASTKVTNFTGFSTPAVVTAIYVVGNRAYGMIGSALNAGKDQPFCYDLIAGAFVAISGITSANSPTSPLTTGDWTPPTMVEIANRIVITHPGYDGLTHFVGWIDVRNFTSTGITGSTHTSTLIDTLSANPLTLDWSVGDFISGAGIPAGAYIVSLTPTSVTISAAASASAAGVALTVTSGTFAAPVYNAGQTNLTPLAAVPVAVAEFNGRAWYAVNNGVQFSDALYPLNITNATQALTMGDSTPVTALCGVPLANQVVGGVVQSLLAFKGAASYYQITGDQATTNLSSNVVQGSVGTLAPNTLTPTPQGIAMIAPDGMRIIGTNGQSGPIVGADGQGVSIPFQFAINPSRMCSAYNEDVFRVSVQNGFLNGQPFREYWYDMSLQVWTGPHSFPAEIIAPYYAASNSFILAGVGINAALWQSTVLPGPNSTYTENGTAMSIAWQPTLLPDNDSMANNQNIQGAIGLALPPSGNLNVLALDENGATLATTNIVGSGVGGSLWDGFNWGGADWGSALTAFQQYDLIWPNTVVFKQATLRVTGASLAGFVIGNAYLQYQVTGYLGGVP